MSVVRFDAVDVVFGDHSGRALDLLDAGHDRAHILAETGSVVGVADANLAVAEGQVCVLMGLSGSGKSSLLRCVNGLNKVSRGHLWVRHGEHQVDVAECDPATLRRLRMHRIAMVFQQFGLLPWRSVRENVGFGLELRGVPRADIHRAVEEKLALVHLETWADKRVAELSGGMQQRVGLARAFATDGDILLMDEPFSALDPLIRTHLQDELLALQERLHKTIVFVSHDLDEALKLGNQIVIMEDGRIVQSGRPEDIVFNPVNDYVRAFVANMNPLQVLTAHALMLPLAELARDGAALLADTGVRVGTDPSGAVSGVQRDGRGLDVTPLDAMDELSTVDQPLIFTAGPGTRLRELVMARQVSGAPVLVVDDGRLTGVVGDREIYDGLLRQVRPDNQPPL